MIGVDVAEDGYVHELAARGVRDAFGAVPGPVYRRCGWRGADVRAVDPVRR